MSGELRPSTRRPAHLPALILCALAAFLATSCGASSVATGAAPTAAPTSAPPTAQPTKVPEPTAIPVPQEPTILRKGIEARKVVSVDPGAIALARHPVSGDVYMLHPGNGLFLVKLAAPGKLTKIVAATDLVPDANITGMTIGPDGSFYLVANRKVGEKETQATVRRCEVAISGKATCKTLLTTDPYPLSNTYYDHQFNGIVISPDGKSLYLNSGSRTDHGEVEDNDGAFPDVREVPLTAKIFRIPTDAVDLVLPNDDAKLEDAGYIFARGTRNAFDLEFAPNGELFAVDNGPDADLPDELNWLREGLHYGFPWRFGSFDNPQRDPKYDPAQDKRLSEDFSAVQNGKYRNDPDFPKAPEGLVDPITNKGPDAGQYRAEDGSQRNAIEESGSLKTFTPHRSPLGLQFGADPKLPADLRGDDKSLSAFLLSFGSAGGTLTDSGKDLLHLRLTKAGDTYEAVTTQIATDFKNPIAAVLIENRLYVLEFGDKGAIWELTLK
jgi:glucose/arabinose dehydrogenase